jgi:predicted ATPase
MGWGPGVCRAISSNSPQPAEKHSLDSHHAFGLGFEGELSAARGDVVAGVPLLRACLDGLRKARAEMFYVIFNGGFAKAVATTGNVDEGLTMIDEALGRAERNGEWWFMPELFRIKGELLLLRTEPTAVIAEDHFSRSLTLARRRGALSWELRTAMSLARLWRRQGRSKEAQELLAPIYGRFSEGFETTDLKATKVLIDELS